MLGKVGYLLVVVGEKGFGLVAGVELVISFCFFPLCCG